MGKEKSHTKNNVSWIITETMSHIVSTFFSYIYLCLSSNLEILICSQIVLYIVKNLKEII